MHSLSFSKGILREGITYPVQFGEVNWSSGKGFVLNMAANGASEKTSVNCEGEKEVYSTMIPYDTQYPPRQTSG